MGDFKCNSGIPVDKSEKTAEDKNLYNSNTGSSNWADQNISDNNSEKSGYSKNNITDSTYGEKGYSQNNITDSTSPKDDYSKNEMSDNTGCGCGSADDIAFPDGSDSAIIYSETVVFTEPYDYDSADNKDMRTSDLIEDEQEGSEFIGSDNNRPQC